MAGRERSGAVSGRGDLFDGRAWVRRPDRGRADPAAVDLVRQVARCGRRRGEPHGARASTTRPSPRSRTCRSSPPASSPPGSRELDDAAVALAGQGLRDVTRIAASDPRPVDPDPRRQRRRPSATCSTRCVDDLDGSSAPSTSCADGDAPGARWQRWPGPSPPGNAGHARIPGKHGAAPTAYDDRAWSSSPTSPGALGRLLADIGEDRRQPRGLPPRPRARPAVRAGRGRRRARRRGDGCWPGPRGAGLARCTADADALG